VVAFHRLRVAGVEALTDDAVAITFDVPEELRAAYAFVQGQHVAISTPELDDDLRRSYSICSRANSGKLCVAVKRLPGGAFSTYAHERLRPGDALDVMTPTGRFFTALDSANEKHYVAIAAGSGITPIMSIAATTLELEPRSRFTLFYGNRATRSIMFLEELADLKDRHLDRLALYHVLSREQNEIELLHGRLGGSKLRQFCDGVLVPGEVDDWFLCGPAPMLEELQETLGTFGVDATRIHRELFYAGPPALTTEGPGVPCTETSHVTIVLDGRAAVFEMSRTGVSILDAAVAVRSDAPYACKGGVCGTCRARVLEGEVKLDRAYALEERELADGFILTCQSHPASENVRIDFDA
jgi:ring-1,2-phenylacetyl-CoA epoxidase subunit PaaE